MPDNKEKKGAPDNKRIDVKDVNELRNWSKSFNTTPAKIKEAVKEVGTSSNAVKKYLQK